MTQLTDFERARFNMIQQQIRPWFVIDSDMLDTLSDVRREDFVPLAHKALAFADLRIPLTQPAEAAMSKGECMLEPRLEVRLLQDRSQRVVTMEINPELVKMARQNLQRAGLTNVEVREADGSRGMAAEGP